MMAAGLEWTVPLEGIPHMTLGLVVGLVLLIAAVVLLLLAVGARR